MRSPALIFVLTGLWLLPHAKGQEPISPSASTDGQGPFTLHVNAQAVVLDVVVTDQKGRIVKGLTKDDFLVYEDKIQQALRTLDISGHEMAAPDVAIHSTVELDRKAPNAPVNILVLDEINTRFEDLAFADYSIDRFLDNQGPVMPPTMLIAVDLDHFMVLQDFTTSKADIRSALKRRMVTNPWHAGDVNWQAQQLTAALNSLLEVAQATSGHPGHKTMIWIGRGFPTIDPLSIDARQADLLETAIKTCVNALRDARVVLYSLDPAGISTEPAGEDEFGSLASDPFGASVDFNEMAVATGGKAFVGRNDIDKLIATSASEGTQFYTLSYVPKNNIDVNGPFRSIKVRMKDPNLTATTRIGYYAKDARAPTPTASTPGGISHEFLRDLSMASDGLMIYDAVPFTVFRDKSKPDTFLLQMRSSDLMWRPAQEGTVTAEISVVVESFDRKGKLLSKQARIDDLSVTANPERSGPAKSITNLPVTISSAPPAARIRFAIRIDSSGKIGTNNYFLVDPKTLQDTSIGLRSSH